MNKKGFTLAELIGVIVVLSLICLITVPAIASVLKTNKKSLCETQLKNVLAAAKSYVSENLLSMPINDGDYKIILMGDNKYKKVGNYEKNNIRNNNRNSPM